MLGNEPHTWWIALGLLFILSIGVLVRHPVRLKAYTLLLIELRVNDHRMQVHIERFDILFSALCLCFHHLLYDRWTKLVDSLTIRFPYFDWTSGQNDLYRQFFSVARRRGANGDTLNDAVITIPITTGSHLLEPPLNMNLLDEVVLFLLSVRRQISTATII